MLNRHPGLAVPFESGFIPDFSRRHQVYGDLRERANAAKLLNDIAAHPMVRKGRLIEDPEAVLRRPREGFADLVDAIFDAYAAGKGKARWGDKTTDYVTELDVLWSLFPSCRVIHLVRDGRDVAVSLRRLTWGSRHLPTLAQDWRWKTMLGHKVGALLGQNYLEIHFEDLVMDPEGTLRRVCEFLGEPFSPDMLTYEQDGRKEMPGDSMRWHQRSVRAPDPALVHSWKRSMSRADRIVFERIARPALELFGYEIENHPSTWASRVKTLYYYGPSDYFPRLASWRRSF
jgi:hypothetical protein